MSNLVPRMRFEVKRIVGNHPGLYLPIARRRMRGLPFTSETELVIEGFPRSGNTFATGAFQLAQRRPVVVAHHEHVPAQVIAAVGRRVPAIVLLRKPEDCIVSYLVQQPVVTWRQALRAYRHFYLALEPYRGGLLLVRFESVIGDFGAVTRALNQRFGTSFDVFEHTPQNVARVFAMIDEDNRRRFGDQDERIHRMGAIPSAVRAEVEERLRDAFRSQDLAASRARADEMYDGLVGDAV